jgi:ribosome-binding factor A
MIARASGHVEFRQDHRRRHQLTSFGLSALRVPACIEVLMPRGRHREKTSSAMPSQRQLRVGEVVRHTVADLLSRGAVHDPVVEAHIVTVPEVRMSPDLRTATIYVMPLGGKDEQTVVDALERNKRFLRGEIARRVNLKFAPDIRFRLDERFDEAERIEKLLRTPEVQRDLEPNSDEKQ